MATLPNTGELWTVREYLRTDWSPDRELVEGRIEERNLGEKEHSILQRFLTFLFTLHRAEWGVEVFPEQRAVFFYTGSGFEACRTEALTVPGTPIRVVLSEMFAELDR